METINDGLDFFRRVEKAKNAILRMALAEGGEPVMPAADCYEDVLRQLEVDTGRKVADVRLDRQEFTFLEEGIARPFWRVVFDYHDAASRR